MQSGVVIIYNFIDFITSTSLNG